MYVRLAQVVCEWYNDRSYGGCCAMRTMLYVVYGTVVVCTRGVGGIVGV